MILTAIWLTATINFLIRSLYFRELYFTGLIKRGEKNRAYIIYNMLNIKHYRENELINITVSSNLETVLKRKMYINSIKMQIFRQTARRQQIDCHARTEDDPNRTECSIIAIPVIRLEKKISRKRPASIRKNLKYSVLKRSIVAVIKRYVHRMDACLHKKTIIAIRIIYLSEHEAHACPHVPPGK